MIIVSVLSIISLIATFWSNYRQPLPGVSVIVHRLDITARKMTFHGAGIHECGPLQLKRQLFRPYFSKTTKERFCICSKNSLESIQTTYKSSFLVYSALSGELALLGHRQIQRSYLVTANNLLVHFLVFMLVFTAILAPTLGSLHRTPGVINPPGGYDFTSEGLLRSIL